MTMQLEGTYNADSGTFEGTWPADVTVTYYSGPCDNPQTIAESGGGRWDATRDGDVVRSTMPVPDPNNTVMEFELTAQE